MDYVMLTLPIATHGMATCSSSQIPTPKKTNHYIFALPSLHSKKQQAAAVGTHICAAQLWVTFPRCTFSHQLMFLDILLGDLCMGYLGGHQTPATQQRILWILMDLS